MKIKVLAENTAAAITFAVEHGLSLYVETSKHRLLFDTGASHLFATNAERLGVDLAKVDLVVLSHGHYDHGGGLATFLTMNTKAQVYVHRKAFMGHFAQRSGGKKDYIGLDPTLLPNVRFQFCDDHLRIDDELALYAGVKAERLMPSGNANLLMQEAGAYIQDDFAHEQNLMISQGDKTLLMTGCAHRGIVNIVEQFRAKKGCWPDYVVGGFHLSKLQAQQGAGEDVIAQIAHRLQETGAQYYSCHCTGVAAYHSLKAVMGTNIEYISAGDTIIIDM